MSSTYKITVPRFDVSGASTASYLDGNAKTKTIISSDGGNINFLNNISGTLVGTSSWAANAASANTSSWANNSIQSNAATTSSFLFYQPGANTGTSSYSITSSHALVANSLAGEGLSGFGSGFYFTATSPLTVNNYEQSVYSANHGFGQTPSLIRITLICIASDLGYDINDEIGIEGLFDEEDNTNEDDEGIVSTTWSNATQVGVSFGFFGKSGLSNTLRAYQKTGTRTDMDETKWKIKIRAWK